MRSGVGGFVPSKPPLSRLILLFRVLPSRTAGPRQARFWPRGWACEGGGEFAFFLILLKLPSGIFVTVFSMDANEENYYC
jgi:hypothetical protein